MKPIRIGLLGFGTVGAGVVAGLQKNGSLIADRTGLDLVMARIADIDLETDRGVTVDRTVMTKDAASVVADPEVDIIVEHAGHLVPIEVKLSATPRPAMAAAIKSLAQALGKRASMPAVPAFMVKLMKGEMGTILLKGQKVLPKRLVDNGFRFRFEISGNLE